METLELKNEEENITKSLIGSWDTLTTSIDENIDEKIFKLLKITANSILFVNWQNIQPLLRLQLTRAMQNCLHNYNSNHRSTPQSAILISAIIELSFTHLWYQTVLAMIFNDKTDLNLKYYCANTNCEKLWTQIQYLAQAGCKDLALKLCICCFNNVPQLKNNDRVREMYFTLLFQLDLLDRLSREMLRFYTCEKGIDFVDRLLASCDNATALSFASCVLHIFLVSDLLSKTTYSYTKNLMEMWVNVEHRLGLSSHSLREKVALLSRIFTTSAHYYLIVHLLVTKFGDNELMELYIELYVRGLSVDLNLLEKCRMEGGGIVEEIHLANVLCNFARIVGGKSLLARECYLSAFSIDPTKDRLKRVEELKHCSGLCHCIVLVRGSCANKAGARIRVSDSQIDSLSEGLLEDLTIVINGARKKILSWELQWTELQKYCHVHLEARLALQKSRFGFLATNYAHSNSNSVNFYDNTNRRKVKGKRRLNTVYEEL